MTGARALVVSADKIHLLDDSAIFDNQDARSILAQADEPGQTAVVGYFSLDAGAFGGVANSPKMLCPLLKKVFDRLNEEAVDRSIWGIIADDVTRKRTERYLRKLERQ